MRSACSHTYIHASMTVSSQYHQHVCHHLCGYLDGKWQKAPLESCESQADGSWQSPGGGLGVTEKNAKSWRVMKHHGAIENSHRMLGFEPSTKAWISPAKELLQVKVQTKRKHWENCFKYENHIIDSGDNLPLVKSCILGDALVPMTPALHLDSHAMSSTSDLGLVNFFATDSLESIEEGVM